MAICYHRKLAWIKGSDDLFEPSKLSFRPIKGARCISLPCGKCLACRVNNASAWATRVMHEATYTEASCFITLTYNPEHCPSDYGLKKSDVQLFLKRLRRHIEYHHLGSIRAFFACGEYGSKKGRPHYHLLVLGWVPDDLAYYKDSYSGEPIYTSACLEKLWGKGFCPVGTATRRSAGYVARYAKKIQDNCGSRQCAFFLASRNIPLTNGNQGALGAQWVLDHHHELRFGYLTDEAVPNVRLRIPDYYYDLLERWYPDEYEYLKATRYDYVMRSNHNVLFCDDPLSHNVSVYATPNYTESDAAAIKAELKLDENLDKHETILKYQEYLRNCEKNQNDRLLALARHD